MPRGGYALPTLRTGLSKPYGCRGGLAESFAWDRQTRAFSVRAPGNYEKYRLVVDGEAVVSEVELLA
ncbi:hypothetical protein [Streptomyces sp. NL15-2K]|uniref:hypothetical protein n=1 Tax=Streptomyces sp. NL15-2K TaxID=376149 RepID=UPI000F57C9F2|nr:MULTISPECIES: hypothetical protein [Actinomycetes]WKX13329.1 hypothetical protein Q4V64_39730 [Kutzneria buriramensis]GCB45303.1 alpha-1,2-mannosidase [Streptomyces sp. NL15-2K]